MPEDPNDLESSPGCLPGFLRRLFDRPRLTGEDFDDIDEDLDAIDGLEIMGRVSPWFGGCLRYAVVVLGICVFTILGILGIDIGDSTTTRIVDLTQIPTTTTTTTESGSSSTPEVASTNGGYVHGPNEFDTPSKEQVCAVVTGVPVGSTVEFSGDGGEGALTVSGTVAAGGRVLAEGGISQLGTKTFTAGEVTNAETGARERLQISPSLDINVEGGTSKPCDPSTLPAAPSESSENTPPAKEPPAAEPTADTKAVTETTDGFPWTLVIAGGLDVLLLAVGFGAGSKPVGAKTYPDWITGPEVM